MRGLFALYQPKDVKASMRKLLSSPVKMALSDAENLIYQNILKYAAELSLNLMAVKVENRPEDFLSWCYELHHLCQNGVNYDLLEPTQFAPLKKMQDLLEKGVSMTQLKMLRIAPWPVFYQAIEQNREVQALDERLRLLVHIESLREQRLAQMNELDIDVFAGKHSAQHDPGVYNFDNEWFASTKGAKLFHQLLLEQTEAFDEALSYIPLEGEVSHQDYKNFVAAYTQIFQCYTADKPEGEKAPLAPATRLLAMRRPDQFIALTNAKIELYCQGFSTAKFNGFDLHAYWTELILTLRSFAFWRQAEPEAENEQLIWRHRALMADLFLFADKTTANNSNYLKLKDRLENKPVRATGTTARKRSKETAEAIVDRRLAEPDTPEYLLAKRDSLVHEVKNGKTVDQAINLFRAIFG